MNRWTTFAIVAASLALLTGTARAQTASDNYPVQVEATVRAVFPQQQSVELEDGTWLTAVSDRQIAQIQPGAKVKVLY
jgi:Protein of unknown function (DUF1344)